MAVASKMSRDGLKPMSPRAGVEMYLEAKRDDLTEATISGQSYRLDAFVQWCDETGVDNLNELSGREIYEYRIWRRDGHGKDRDPIEQVTLRGQLSTVRAFLRFCGDVNAVPSDLFEKVPLPTVTGGEAVSESTLEPQRAERILDYLDRYMYASTEHVMTLMLWYTGARVSGVRALDLEDCDLESEHPGVEFNHRPETGTGLKNKEESERWNVISEYVARVLRDYIDGPRDDVRDEHGRRPLITTSAGRPHVGTYRKTMYRVTRPCWYANECPHDKDIDTCEWTRSAKMSKCPSARSPHDFRSGRVTAYRQADVKRWVVSERLNASGDVLDKHYDRRGKREQAEQRRKYLGDL